MGDRRDDERRFRGERRDPETERRIERLADRYRGSDERGYGGGERLGRDWEPGEERFDRGERGLRDMPMDHGELRLRNPGRDRDVRRYADLDRDRQPGRGSGAVRHPGGHSDLVGLHDLDDMSKLREHFRARHPQDEVPRYGHGPGVENMDRHRPPRPMGRGPKNYQRADDRIREDLCDRLMMSWMDAENVEVLVVAGEVTLEGTVKTRDEKRAIEALAESVLGVKDIHNALRVERGGPVRTEARPGQEQRAKDAEPTPGQQPGDTPLHS
ncbi:BON domain-containing protein [Hyalangium sp.]|uniref:BON domain-containing protein n=1 Tax=Hyalangium sp. TaxID=2028555 RepID=UPI002D619AB9|nr:BON domain-containing protein [Hyalangium sp.]HYH97905.1 BON domain-containing protein [Hyalangium sp.]